MNNGAAALLLVLSTLAAGRGVLVSRGELLEIGGGFRIPEIMSFSGARLVEVGTTNMTRAEDYTEALATGENDVVAAILVVHQANFEMRGFVGARIWVSWSTQVSPSWWISVRVC